MRYRGVSDDIDDAILNEPLLRRWWLLSQALRGSPLEMAIEVARRAEAFLVGEGQPEHVNGKSMLPAPNGELHDIGREIAPRPIELPAPEPEASLDNAQKEELKARLAAGASNGELAADFGITLRQVQGFRMQLARKAARPEATQPNGEERHEVTNVPRALIEEVVRYLRQQGDVVVGAGNSQFLVNGRISVTFEQLLHRANRMRNRQKKPEFVLPADQTDA